jgi:F0F1-type ATP synthase membrane subunit b/b'
MDLEFLIDRLERYLLEESPKIPLSGNRAVNEEEIRVQLTQIREAVPQELAEARQLVRQREEFLAQAKQEAAQIVAEAEVEAQRRAGEHRIVKEAREQADLILRRVEEETEGLRAGADEYAFDILSTLQADLTRLLRVVENGLQKLETDRERRLQES